MKKTNKHSEHLGLPLSSSFVSCSACFNSSTAGHLKLHGKLKHLLHFCGDQSNNCKLIKIS